MRKLILPIAAVAALAVPTAASAKVVTLHASMKGSNEVPGPGASGGSGSATIKLNKKKGQVCYNMTVRGIDPATAAHIHAGKKGVAGNVVVALLASQTSSTHLTGCVNADKGTIKKIIKSPKKYYVNVHTTAQPGGAIRGQLHK